MLEQHVHYITEPLKGLIFTLSADSGLPNIFSLNPQETKWLSVRDKIINGNLEILFMHRNTTTRVVLLHNRLNNIPVQDCVILFQRNSCLINDLYEVENMPKNYFFEHTWTWKMV